MGWLPVERTKSVYFCKARSKGTQMKRAIKGCAKSYTMWFNGALVGLLAAIPELQATLPALQEYLPADVYKWLTFAALVGNMMLRVKTKSALSDK